MTQRNMVEAINDALAVLLEKDGKILLFGEDVGKNGGVFRATDGLQAKFGKDRVFDTPLAESGILGLAFGLGVEGFRPLPEIQFLAFITEAMDQVASHISRQRYRSGNTRNMPMTIRTPFGGGVHTPELHSDYLEGLLAQIPGLRVVIPSTPYDAKGLLISAVENNDPVVFLEHLGLYRAYREEVPDGYYTVPLDKAKIVREGSDITVISYGALVREAVKAAELLAQDGVSVEVIDLLTVAPVDMETIIASVSKTGRVIIAQEAQRQAGVAAGIASEIAERAFLSLEAPVTRVTAPDTTFPFGAAEELWLPSAENGLIEKIKEVAAF
jgi:pyruvate dehydrogenase E1 component beta subunit